jgi:putative CRISPR-associated protein (TIGR02619 family)
MKTVITIVGTSIFENYMSKYPESHLDDNINELKNRPYSEFGNYFEEINIIKRSISGKNTDKNSSAEINSLIEIQKEINDEELKVYLLTSDTILSYLAAEIIVNYFDEFNKINNSKIAVIKENIKLLKGFQVNNRNEFENIGVMSIVKIIKEIKATESNIILNISGGYKIGTPFFTIIGQVYELDTYYIYQDTDELIKVPILPIKFDELLSEEIYYYLTNLMSIPKINRNKYKLKYYNLIKFDCNKYILTPIGELFKSYIEEHFPIAKNVYGYYIEYKIYEYLIENPYKLNNVEYNTVKHSIYIDENEIDILLKNSLNCKDCIICEIKSALAVVGDSSINKLEKQIRKRCNALLKNRDYNIKGYNLYLYAINYSIKRNIITNNLKSIVNEINEVNIPFHVYYTEIILNDLKEKRFEDNLYRKYPYKNQNDYQYLMQKKLENKDIEKIEISKEVRNV